MSEVWVTNPALTPAHDFKCARAALGTWLASGWVERADQSDPVEVEEPADPRERAFESPALSGPSKPSPALRKES